jgi:hypothetical protein
MALTCRQLITFEDYKEAVRLVEENSTFQKNKISFAVRTWFISRLYIRIGKSGPTNNQYYFGAFNEEGKLLAWTHFVVWDEKPVFTYGAIFATNTIPLEKIEGTRYSKAVQEVVDFGFSEMEKLGLTEGYMQTPQQSDWRGHLRHAPNETVTKWDWEDYEYIDPHFGVSEDSLINKYVLLTEVTTPQKIMKFTKKNA